MSLWIQVVYSWLSVWECLDNIVLSPLGLWEMASPPPPHGAVLKSRESCSGLSSPSADALYDPWERFQRRATDLALCSSPQGETIFYIVCIHAFPSALSVT